VAAVGVTPTRQRNAVSEGIALGLLLCGRDELPYDKVAADLSFEGAWRKWPYTRAFPQVSTDLRNGKDGVHAMTRADVGKQTFNLYWEMGGGLLSIHWRGSWHGEDIDPEEVASAIDGDVPASGWKALAQDFLTRFERHPGSR
jgi:hypothetical protein